MNVKKFKDISAICLFLLLSKCLKLHAQSQASQRNNLEINFTHYVDTSVLLLDSGLYKNDFNQDFSITKFKYYIGNLTFTRINGEVFFIDDYFLIDEEKPNSKKLSLKNVTAGEYVSISFTIGVDSIDNCSGAQSGALDPINGMFWTWNTGYIFMKLEGVSNFSSSPNAALEYHIGGFKKTSNCIRNVLLPLNKPIFVTAQNKEKIEIKTDVLEILKTPTAIDFSTLSSVTDFNNATIIADNYSDIFSVLTSK
jgi:hypothetical protein